jgi:hypothetical protein
MDCQVCLLQYGDLLFFLSWFKNYCSTEAGITFILFPADALHSAIRVVLHCAVLLSHQSEVVAVWSVVYLLCIACVYLPTVQNSPAINLLFRLPVMLG